MSIENAKGVIEHDSAKNRPTDYLYRVSLKALIRDERGRVLVVKEGGRTYWDLPGGGMDHGETIDVALARELHEEVGLRSSFTWRVLTVDQPKYSPGHDFWQMRIIIEVTPGAADVQTGEDGDEITFIDPIVLKDSPEKVERWIYEYATMHER